MAFSVAAAALAASLSGLGAGAESLAPAQALLQAGEDPATTVFAAWRAKGDGPHFLEVLPVGQKGEPLSVSPSSSSVREPDFMAGEIHRARVQGLTPGRWHRWRVVSSGLATPWRSFRTAEKKASPFTFLVMGDAQSSITSVSGSLFALAAEKAPQSRFTLHAGDMIDNNLSVEEWEEWLRACQPLPGFHAVTPGNHEYGIYGRAKRRDLSPLFMPYFAAPSEGPHLNGAVGLPGTTWWFDYQGVRVASLDTMKPLEPQVKWLESLPKNEGWLVLIHHYPVFPSMKGQEAPGRTKLLKEAYERLGVDLVFTGHLHSYARSGLIQGREWDSEEGGVLYMISNSGGKHYRQDPMPWIKVGIPRLTSFALVKASPEKLEVEARDTQGQVRDRFVIHRGEKGSRLED